MFQFYLSSIKSPGRLPQEGVDDGFNSTLVQLKEDYRIQMTSRFLLFQFYLSSIKSPILFRKVVHLHTGFNSTLVQLKVYIHEH